MSRGFDMEEFLEVVVPSMLTNRTDYYIKGGLAYDAYFKNKTNSVDFDVIGTPSFVKYVQEYLTEYSKNLNINLSAKISPPSDEDGFTMVQFAFKDYTVDGKDPFFMDVVLSDSNLEYITMCGLNYMTLVNFVVDLLVTQDHRLVKTKKYTKVLMKENKDDMYKDIEEFNKKYSINLPIVSNTTVILDNTIKLLDYYLDNCVLNEKVVCKIKETTLIFLEQLRSKQDLKIIDDILPVLNDVNDITRTKLEDEIEDKTEQDEIDEHMDIWDDFIIEYVNVLAAINGIINTRIESESIFSKYKKTRKRFKNVVDISWENLSTKFKRYLLVHCDRVGTDLELFNHSETCKAYIKCLEHNFQILKNVSNCADESKYAEIDDFLK